MPSRAHSLDLLAARTRLGLVGAPTPITVLPCLGPLKSLEWVGIKRDDLLSALHGGTKVRKLDHLLACPPWRDAPRWASMGAVGSGQLVALSAAASALGRSLDAYLFEAPLTVRVVENLAFLASGSVRLDFALSRPTCLLRRPSLFLGGRVRGAPVIAPGASEPAGLLGLVDAGVELGRQVDLGELPSPAHVFVALGSAGTTAGLLVGLCLAGLSPTVHAVSAVEPLLASRGRVLRMARALLKTLELPNAQLPPLRLHKGYYHPRYAVASPASQAAVAFGAEVGLTFESLYTGKALAALFDLAPSLSGPVLFWNTTRAADPLPIATDFRDRLPLPLAEALRRFETPEVAKDAPTRRVFIVAALTTLTAASAFSLSRAPTPPLRFAPLSSRLVLVLTAVARVALPLEKVPDDLLVRIAAFVSTFPKAMHTDLSRAALLIEALPLTSGRLSRFSALTPQDAAGLLTAWLTLDDVRGQAARGLRDLVLGLWYTRSETWATIGYRGPNATVVNRLDEYAQWVSARPLTTAASP